MNDIIFSEVENNQIGNLSRISIRKWKNILELNNEIDSENEDDSEPKRKILQNSCFFVTISHDSSSTIENVGKQLWRSSFLMSDYLINNSSSFDDKLFMDLGCGIGFNAIILSLIKHKGAFITDINIDILDFAKKNYYKNSHLSLSLYNEITEKNRFKVFDWSLGIKNFSLHEWSSNEIDKIKSYEVTFIASDVIYDDDLTQNFFQSLCEIMKSEDSLIIALDKRYNFSIDIMDLVPHGYKYFLEIIGHSDSLIHRTLIDENKIKTQFWGQIIDYDDIPFYCNYDSRAYLELWVIKIKKLAS